MTTTKTIGAAKLSGVWYMLYAALTDGSAGELTVKTVSGTLKSWSDVLNGQVLTDFWIFVATPSDLDKIQLLDENGGIVNEWAGCINAALGHNPQAEVHGLTHPIKAGYTFMVTTSD